MLNEHRSITRLSGGRVWDTRMDFGLYLPVSVALSRRHCAYALSVRAWSRSASSAECAMIEAIVTKWKQAVLCRYDEYTRICDLLQADSYTYHVSPAGECY